MFTRNSVENSTQVALKISANKLPFNSSTAFHTTRIVNAPKRAGKNLTQNTEPPKIFIRQDIQEVNGGTDRYPQAK